MSASSLSSEAIMASNSSPRSVFTKNDAIVAVSTDDPYIAVERARVFAQAWGSQLVLVGALGHINSDSDLGVWPKGLGLLARLVGDERFGA